MISAAGNAVTPSARAAALRSTALATSLALAVGLSACAADACGQAQGSAAEAAADRAQCRPEYAAKNTAPRPAQPPGIPRPSQPRARAAPAMAPATRQHAALPPPTRKPTVRRPRSPRRRRPRRPTPMRWKTSSNWCASTSRRTRPRLEAAISDPVAQEARRMDHPAQRRQRRLGRALSRVHHRPIRAGRRRPSCAGASRRRCGTTIATTPPSWAWFENETPLSAKGKFSLARAMIARGDRANAERLVRDAWRSDPMSEDTESAALDLFGALLTPGDHKARMDFLLYGSEHEAALRAAKRLGARPGRAGEGAHRGLSQGLQHQGAARSGAARTARRSRLHLQQDPAAAPRREIRRGRAADAGRAEGSRPPVQSRRMVDRTAAAVAQDARHRRAPHRLSDRARRRAARARHLQDRAGIHRGLDRAALPDRPCDGRAAFCAHRRRQRQPDRAGARRLLAGPRRRGRRPLPGGARRLHARPPSNRPAITASWRAPSSACRRSS